MTFVVQDEIWEQLEVFVSFAYPFISKDQGKRLLEIVKDDIILDFWTFL